MKQEKERLLGKQVWCQDCLNKVPVVIRRADYLVPTRKNPYDLCPAGLGVDKRVHGVCDSCLEHVAKFQRDNAEAVDVDHEHLVYKAG